ncbi:hypothetical protein Q7P37_004593 [Cladosporium fusiforme]
MAPARGSAFSGRPSTNIPSGDLMNPTGRLTYIEETTRTSAVASDTGLNSSKSKEYTGVIGLFDTTSVSHANNSLKETNAPNSTHLTPTSRDYSMITDWATLLPPTGSGGAYAWSCEALNRSWSSASTQWFFKHRVITLVTSTETIMHEVYDSKTAEIVQTSCLGAQRELGGETLSISPLGMTTYYETYTYEEYTSNASYPAPRPTCSFDVTACNSLWDMHDDYMNSVATMWPDGAYETISPIYYPACEPDRPGKYCDSCTISANSVQMFYWPPVAIGEPCDPNRRFTTATPTLPGRPNTIVFDTTTFTSPTIYLSFSQLSVQQKKAFGYYDCGKQLTNLIVPIRPESVSSIRFTRIDYANYTATFTFGYGDDDTTVSEELVRNFTIATAGPPMPVSFGDFLGPVPVDAYMGQATMAEPGATTEIVDILYSPHVAVPEQLRSLDPLWKNCEIFLEGVYDPPLPLMAVSSIALPSIPTFITTTTKAHVAPGPSAAPASLPATPQASVTADAPSQNQKPPSQSSEAASTADPSDSTSQSPPNDASAGKDSVNPVTKIVSIIKSLESAGSRIVTLNGVEVVVSSQGSVAVVDGQSVTFGGNAATIRGQEVSLATNGLHIASSTTVRFGSSSAVSEQKTAVWNNGTIRVSATQMGNKIVFSGGSAVATVAFGQSIIIQGHTFSVSAGGGTFQVDSGEVITMQSAENLPGTILLPDGDNIMTVIRTGSKILLNGDTASTTLAPGGTITFDGKTMKALPSNAGVRQEGEDAVLFDPSSQMRLTIGGKPVTAVMLDGNTFLLISGSSALTVASGERATIDGVRVELLADGLGLIVKETSLLSLSKTKARVDFVEITASSGSSTAFHTSIVNGDEAGIDGTGGGGVIATGAASRSFIVAFNCLLVFLSTAVLLIL